jgi:dTDP-4-amino-4,6-dideoxygalactose transaminase
MWKARLSELEYNDRELAAVLEALGSEWITAGPRTQAFELKFADLIGVRHAVAVSNGTAALFLALKAAGVGPGDEVLCPSMTFVATAAAVMQCGGRPVFVDIVSLENPTMSPEDAARKITPRTKAILPVHYAGIPAEMDALCALASSAGLALIEDAAHSPAARYGGRACGSFGTAGCFSFFGNKNMTTAEGGMITTNDPDIASRVRLLRSHGMTVTSWDRDKGRACHYDVVEVGFNFRLDDIRAALGLAQLRKLKHMNSRRAAIVRHYNELFAQSGLDVTLPFASVDHRKEPAYHIYPVVFPDSRERDSMSESLKAEGIQTSIHYNPVHQFSAFRKLDPDVHLPLTEAFAARELTLPLYPSLSEAQVDTIVSTVVHCYTSAHEDSQERFLSWQARTGNGRTGISWTPRRPITAP